MIELFFEGRVKNRRKYEEFACDCINDLIPRAFKREIDILIKFTKKDIGAMGWCLPTDKNSIGIVVNTDAEPKMIAQTIAHELTHAKQYIRGELNDTMTRWKKEEIPYGPRGGIKIKYRQQPWEIEAFEKEIELTRAYW